MKMIRIKIVFLLLVLSVFQAMAQYAFVHPGISHKKSDLDRMKAMVEAQVEPYYSAFGDLRNNARAKYDYAVKGRDTFHIIIQDGENFSAFRDDSKAAYLNALMWAITGDERHAQKCVEIFNAWCNLTCFQGGGTEALNAGRVGWQIIEAAEIIKSTYSGWSAVDIQRFKDMLVYPGYSNTTKPASVNSNNGTFYWRVYQGDAGRHGNQDLFGWRVVMAMGIFLDNEVMFDRAYRYFTKQPHRSDDIPYESGPPVGSDRPSAQTEWLISYPSTSRQKTIPDYGYNGVLDYYILETGQCQESARDQEHAGLGLGMVASLAEMAWNQGYDIYSMYNNRILKGYEWALRYNVSYLQTYPDQPTAWEPSVENGEFIQYLDRTKRWYSLKVSPYNESGDTKAITRGKFLKEKSRPIYEIALAHYNVRAGLPADATKWTQRALDINGLERLSSGAGVWHDHLGWGGLSFHRTAWMAGDAGTWTNGNRVPEMPSAPCTLKAVDYDYYPGNGEGHTYHNGGKTNSALYRTDGTIEIAEDEGSYVLTDMLAGEWMNYSVIFPAPAGNTTAGITKKYNIYATYKSAGSGVKLFAAVDNNATMNGKELEPASEWTEHCLGTFEVPCGAAVVRIYVKGVSNLLQLKDIRIEPTKTEELAVVDLSQVASSVKVYDASNVDITESNQAVVAAATDGDKNVPIDLPHQKSLVYDFGEDGLDIRDITLYNDGVIMDTREQAKALGSTAAGKYTGAWDRNAASDILRTNGATYSLNVLVINNSWVTADGSNGLYQVGPLGKYRYFCFYNWSAAGRISELEIRSLVTTSTAAEDTEASAEWDNTDDTGNSTSISAIASESSIKVSINGRTITVRGASAIDAYSVAGSKQAVSKTEQITLPSGTYMLKIDMNGQAVNRKVMVK